MSVDAQKEGLYGEKIDIYFEKKKYLRSVTQLIIFCFLHILAYRCKILHLKPLFLYVLLKYLKFSRKIAKTDILAAIFDFLAAILNFKKLLLFL